MKSADKITFLPVTEANRDAVLALCVAPGQQGFIETTQQCLEEADETACWRPTAIYAGGQLIGFAMYGFWENEGTTGRLWLDRFMLDRQAQGRGYAKPALEKLMREIIARYREKELYLSLYEDNVRAMAIYRALGFMTNGERDIHGELVMVYRVPEHAPEGVFPL